MNYNELYGGQKGITPVVAIVMLLMLTIAVVGGAFAFINGYIGDQLTEASQQANADVKIRDVTCDAGSNSVDFVIDNTGDIELDETAASAHLRQTSNNQYLEELDLSGTYSSDQTLGPNDPPWRGPTSVSSVSLQPGQSYTVNFEFDEVSGQRGGTCTA